MSAVAAANPHTIVVLETGGPAAMPWIGNVSAAIEVWYPGHQGREALANILFGDVESVRQAARDVSPKPTPTCRIPRSSGCDLPARRRRSRAARRRRRMPAFDIDYTEGLKVGYKWFDAENKEPLYSPLAMAFPTPPTRIPD